MSSLYPKRSLHRRGASRAGGRWRSTLAALAVTTAPIAFASGCDDSPTAPTDSAIVTFQVQNEQFRARLTSKPQIDAARAAQNGGSANIPVGRLAAGTDVNTGWSWHLVDIRFAEVTTEVCDGLPSDVERAGITFANGNYCPWSARVVDIR